MAVIAVNELRSYMFGSAIFCVLVCSEEKSKAEDELKDVKGVTRRESCGEDDRV